MENVRKTLLLPLDIVKRIEKYQKDNYISTFTSAVTRLIIKGLEAIDSE